MKRARRRALLADLELYLHDVAGFLDKRSRVLDVILTDEGRRQLAAGGVDVAFFALVDDGVDYSPPVTGSRSLEDYVETIPMLECMTGVPSKADPLETERLNARDLLFTSSGRELVPSFHVVPSSLSGSISARREDGVVSDSSALIVAFSHDDGAKDGFVVQAMESGSDGPVWTQSSQQLRVVQDHLGVYRLVVR